MWVGRDPSPLRLKHAVRQAGGKFVTWGRKHQHVLEYFVFGSQDANADILLLYAGAFSPGEPLVE